MGSSIKSVNRSLYKRYVNHDADARDIIEYIESVEGGRQLLDKHIGAVLEAYIISARKIGSETNRYYTNYKQIMENESSDDDSQSRAYTIINIIQNIRSREDSDIVQMLSKKINITDRFLNMPPKI